MKSVSVDIEDRCGPNRICVRWNGFDKDMVSLVRKVPGRTYVKSYGRHWHVPLDLESCRLLRELFGDALSIGPSLRSWASAAVRTETKMWSTAQADTAELERLPLVLPGLYRAIHLGPLGRHMTEEERVVALAAPASYQAADVRFLTDSEAPLNGNEQGLGKTPEWIATVWEAGLEEGDHLIICPKAAADGTWEPALEQWQAEALDRVGIFLCVQETPEERRRVIREWQASTKPVRWVIVNPNMVMLEKERRTWDPFNEEWTKGTWSITERVRGKRKEEKACYCRGIKNPHEHYRWPYPEIAEATWRTICIDEAHRGMVRNHRAITARSMSKLKRPEKMCLMSGTPMKKMGGVDIWGMLNFLNPSQFSSFWRFADSFFEIIDNGFGKKVGKLREDREEAMFRTLTPYVLRRTKAEAAPWLPPKIYIDVDVRMSRRQAQQYRTMEQEAVAMLGRTEVAAVGTLDRIIRLKQFANAHCKIDRETGEVTPLASPKIEAMIQKMEEIGMFDEWSTRQQLVFSQSKKMIRLAVAELRKAGLRVEEITGETKARRPLVEQFQAGGIDVMCIVTTAGGVSLTLDNADEVHMLDEMWSPDDDEQAEDRAHRVSRIHQVTVFTYRTLDTVDEDIALTKVEKADSHERILDVRRRILARART